MSKPKAHLLRSNVQAKPAIDRQSGLALIMVLLIVVMAGVIALDMVSRAQLDVRRTGNMLSLDQGIAYATGAEPFVAAVLEKAFADSDDWLTLPRQTLPDFVIPGGVLSITIEDLQANYNINSLSISSGNNNQGNNPGNAAPKSSSSSFELLLNALDLSSDVDIKVVAESVLDWLDSDSVPTGVGGVEDDFYLLRETPYRAANMLMQDITELRLIKGIDNNTYSTLEPFVSILPVAAKINLNTAPVAVIRTLSAKISADDAQEIVSLREDSPLDVLPAVLKDKGVSGNQVVFRSEYFRITTQAIINDRRSYLQSVIFLPIATASNQGANAVNNSLKPRVLSRNQSYRYIASGAANTSTNTTSQ